MLRKIFYTIIILFGFLIATAIALPYFFKDKLIEAIEDTANEKCHCKVTFEDANLSLFKSFPFLNVTIKNMSIVGVEEYKDVPLFSTQELGLDLNVMDVVRGIEPLVIKGVELNHPLVNIILPQKGKANFDVVLSTSTTKETSSAPLNFEISQFNIVDANVKYVDRLSNNLVVLDKATFKGEIISNDNVLTVNHTFDAHSLLLKSGNIKYLNNIAINTKGNIIYNANINKVEIYDFQILLNSLHLGANGAITMQDDAMNINFEMTSGKVGLRELYSVIPIVYTKDYADYKFEGAGNFTMIAKGDYTFDGRKIPTIDMKMNIENGRFSYPEIPYPVDKINAKLHVNSIGTSGNQWSVDLPNFGLEVNDEKVNGSFYYNGVGTNGMIKGQFDGDIDLHNFDPNMKGQIKSDIAFDGRIDDVLNQNYRYFNANGTVNIKNLKTKYEGKVINVTNLDMSLSPQKLLVKNINANIGKSDFNGDFAVKDPIAYILQDNKSEVTYNISGKTLNVDEWMTNEPVTGVSQNESISLDLPFKKLGGDLSYDNFIYDSQIYQNFYIKQSFTGDDLNIINVKFHNKDVDIDMKGKLHNLQAYLDGTGAIKGDINLKSKRLFLDKYMSSEVVDTTVESALILLPENVDVQIDADIDHLIYDTYDAKNIYSSLDLKDEKLSFKNMTLELYDSPMQMTGFYTSVDASKPQYDIDYKLKKLDYQKALASINMLKKYMPILKNLNGDMNFSLKAKGSLDKNGMPDFSDITASGFIQTLTAIFEDKTLWPIISDKLGLKSFSKLNLKNTKNWFEIKDGNFAIKPFTFDYEGINFAVQGKHSLTADMDYSIKMVIPAAKLDQNKLTKILQSEAHKLLGYVEKLGLKKTSIDSYEWMINVGGEMKKPKFGYKFLGVNGQEGAGDIIKDQASAVLETVKDSLENRINEEKDKLQKEAHEKVNEVVDSVKTVVNEKVNEVVDTLKGKFKDEAKEIIIDKADEVLKDVINDDAIEKAKEKLKKWNPFKK